MNAVPHEHISNAVSLTTVTINTNTNGDNDIYTPTHSEALFVVYRYHLRHQSNLSTQVYLWKSGSTEIASQLVWTASLDRGPEISDNGMPVLIARAAGDVLKLNLSSTLQTHGMVLVGEVLPRGVQ
jgi:hypothetical protein